MTASVALFMSVLVVSGCSAASAPAAAAGPSSSGRGIAVTEPGPASSLVPSARLVPSANPTPPPTRAPSPADTVARSSDSSSTGQTAGPPPSGPAKPPPDEPPPAPPQPAGGPAGSIRTTGTTGVALTFDDGPDPGYTPRLLDHLKANGVKATFCLVGFRARTFPDLVRRIANEGHTLCNHTWAHALDLGQQSKEVILKDLQDTNNAIRAAAPGRPIRYFRAPGGYFSPMLVGMAGSLGMHSIYWSIDTRDWEFSVYGHGPHMVDHIITTVQTRLQTGAIILSHDYQKPDTIAAFHALLPWLKDRVTLIPLPND